MTPNISIKNENKNIQFDCFVPYGTGNNLLIRMLKLIPKIPKIIQVFWWSIKLFSSSKGLFK